MDAGPSFQWDEIAKHTSAKDCWVVIDAVVYDMTSFLPDHPGGKRLPLKLAVGPNYQPAPQPVDVSIGAT